MNFVTRAAKKSPRLIVIGLFIALISTIVSASKWESVNASVLNFVNAELSGKPSESNVGELKKSGLVSGFTKDEIFLTPGTCDTTGPIEVEGSIVGATPTAYTTLGAAFTAINAGTHTGTITIDVCGDTSEGAATATLNASGSGSASYTSITMSPAGGAARTISGATTAGSPMVDFNGADNITINGLNTGGNSLTISNTTVSATSGTATVRFIGGATGNTITNSNIQGSVSSSVATNGAVIFFSTDAVTANGNDNNTISNNNIGPAGANLPTKAILGNGSTTTAAIGNSGIIITNNNIFDYFGAAVTSAGVATNGGCNGWSITNNRFYQTGTRTWTTGALHNAIILANSTATSGAQGFTVTGNIIGYASNTQTGTYTLTGSTGKFVGIQFNGITGGTVSNINSNTVAAVSLTGVTSSGTSTSSPMTGIVVVNGVANTNSNTIGSQSATGSLTFSTTTTNATDVYGIFNFSVDDWTANGNNIGGISVTNAGVSGTFLVFGMRANTSTAKVMNAASNNVGGTVADSIQLSSTGAASQVVGMGTANAIATWTSNTVRNLTNNNGTGTTTTASMIGMLLTTTTPSQTVTQNTIFGLTNTSTTLATVVTGIQFTGGTANVVARNRIYGLTTATNSATAEVNGIRVAGGTTIYRNNMIAIGAGITNAIGAVASNSSTSGVNGINEALGTNQFFHNSVYIGGAPPAGTGASYAFNGTQTTNTRSFRDNIFFNARNNSGATSKNYAVKINGTTPNPTGLTINNNVYFANGSGAVFGFFNSLDVANLAAWKTAVGQDANSFESNPQYLDPTNATPDLHINPSVSTVIEGNGADVGVTDDFDGQSRSGLTPVDIGADAGNFIGVDFTPPVISYTALGNTTATANRVLSVTLTDQTGVATGGLAPRIYFNKNAGANSSTACALSSGTLQNGVWNCTIDYALVGGVVTSDTIRYFVVAQDAGGNLASNPSAGFAGTDVNNVTTNPTTPNRYLISAVISGIRTVCASGCDYTTLTGATGIFKAINEGVATGNIEIQIAGDLTVGEDGTNGLNTLSEQPSGSNFTVRVYPTGAARAIAGSATGALIRTVGASRVTIDGSIGGTGTDRSLTITNTSVTTPSVILFGSVGTTPITNNILKNCVIINGINTSSAVVISDATTLGNAGFFTNITIQNNDVQKSFTGVFATGGTTPQNGSNLTYTGNTFNATGANAVRSVGLYMQGVNGATVSNNTVGNIDKTNDENDAGIWLATGTTNATVSGNTIAGIGYTGTGAFAPIGINITSGVASTNNNITGNTVSDISTSGSTQVRGIAVTGTTSDLTIQKNNVQGVNNTNTGTFGAYGIDISGGNNIVVRNNFVSNVNFNMTGGAAFSTTFGIFGIRVGAGTGHKIYNNSVNLYGALPGTATTSLLSAAFGIVSTTSTGMDVRNNIFANNITGGTTSVAHVSVYLPSGAASAMNLTWNNNSYYFGTDAARQGVGQAGTTAGTNFYTTLPALAAYTATLSAAGTNDNASLSSTGSVPFTSANDLHISSGAAEIDTGTTIAAVTDDFDGNLRPLGSAYEIGADEIVPATPGTIQFSAATYSVTEGTPTVTLTVTRTGGSSGAVTANYTLSGGTATGTAVCGTAGEDYVNTGSSVIFADGDAADKTFDVPICNDGVYELNQTFNATLAIGSGTATLGTLNPATVTINNDDAAPTIAINDVSQAEGNSGTANFGFGIVVTGASEVSAVFSVQTADNTATQPSDYSSLSTPIAAPADVNRTSTTYPGLVVAVNGDTMFEANETFFLNSSGCSDCTISDNQAVGTIQNDDVQPTVQFSSATYTNADDIAKNVGKVDQIAPQVATITVTRAGAAGDAFAVNYATGGGSATGGAICGTGSGVDYVSTSGTLTFAAGDMSKTFNITVCTDNLFEGDETVNLTLTSPSAPVILGTPNAAVMTITDNDTQPSLQFSAATYSNSDDITRYGVTTDEFTPSVATITVTRTGAVDNAVAVSYATSNGTATGGGICSTGVDYVSTSGTLNFAVGVISQDFSVTVCTDALFEGSETLNLTLTDPTGGAALGTPNSAVLTILDNDAQPSLQFSSATYSVGEAGPAATITVTRTGAPDNAVTVNYATSSGTATGGGTCLPSVDYQNAIGTLNFAAGEMSKTFTVSPCDDASAESSETVNLALTSPTGAVLGTQNTAELTITDNDAAPTLQFSATAVSVSEAAGTVTLTVTRAGAIGNAVSVDYGTSVGTATAGVCAPGIDYNSASGTLNFASGETEKMFNITLCNDAVYELNQAFNVTLSNAAGGATIGIPSSQTVTINNDDAAPTVTINDISLAEGNSGTANFQTTFTVSGANEMTGGFNLQTADSTATTPSDYTAIAPTAVVIPANVNRTTATLNGSIVLVNGDTTVEADETFFLNGSGCTDCSFSDNQGVATIQNDDATFQFSSATGTVGEGAGSITLTVTRTGSTTGAATVNYATANDTAAGGALCGAGVDYVSNSGTLNFASGDTLKTFDVTICDDAGIEAVETLTATLSSPTGATLGTPVTETVTITDNDSDTTPPTVSYTPLSNIASSSDRTFNVTATDNIGVTAVTVVWANNGGASGSLTNPCTFVSGTAQNGVWSCTILSGFGSPPQTNPGTVSYFVSADDAATNSTTNPTGGTLAGGTRNLFTVGSGGTVDVSTVNTFESVVLGSNFTLNGNAVVTGNLTLGGVLNTGANKITLACGATITGGGEANYIAGRLERLFCTNETFTFNVGAPFVLPPVAPDADQLAPEGIASNYSPLTVTVTAGDVNSSLTVSATDAFLPDSINANSVSRFWTVTENGNLTVNMSLTYRNEDVNGDEDTYKVLKRAGGVTTQFVTSTNNSATNTATILGVSDFSDWSVGTAVPTAANASIGGRLMTANGAGIGSATVMLSGGGLLEPVYLRTGTFGNYRFDNLPVGQTYIVTVISRRFTFAEPTRIINLNDSVTDENFVAEQP